MRIIKAGILDDVSSVPRASHQRNVLTRIKVNVINSTKPGAELYAPERIKWVSALSDAGQMDAMPPS